MKGFKSGQSTDLADPPEEDQDESKASGSHKSEGQPTTEEAELPYVMRRAMKSKPATFERETRLNFYVHGDIERGEKRLLLNLSDEYEPDLTKYDLREAVYRAALRNEDDVREELEEMGYSGSEG